MLLTRRMVRMQVDTALAQWCTDSTSRRYLTARNWDVSAATKMLRNTLEWWGPYWAFRQHVKYASAHLRPLSVPNGLWIPLFRLHIGRVRKA